MEIEVGKRYRHFKGKIVEVILLAKHSETEEELVIYQHDGEIWARPVSLFLSKVDHEKYPDIKQEYRFMLLED